MAAICQLARTHAPTVVLCLLAAASQADVQQHGPARPDTHAPIGVMADHIHQRGEWMFSWRYMHMNMQDSRRGNRSLSPEAIATTVANRFAGQPGQPPTLRVVPLEMDMAMHMLGVMYAPAPNVTLMAMAQHVNKRMEHITFAGGAGTSERGRFTTQASGLGDTSVSALVSIVESAAVKLHATVGVSLPTGDIRKRDDVLAPNGATPTLRLPYPMQLGSGTFDAITGLTASGQHNRWGWGGQWRSQWRTGDNDAGYALGDVHQLSLWGSWLATPALSVSARLAGLKRGNVDGRDLHVVAPVQTADPDYQGARRLNLNVGFNWILPRLDQKQRLALEVGVPLAQNLDGPQLESRWHLTAGYQLSL